jgi:hypothetical protein
VTGRTTVAFRVTRIRTPDRGGYGDCVLFLGRRPGDERFTTRAYMLPISNRGFRQMFELLLDSLARGLVAEVTADEPDEVRPVLVVAVTLRGAAGITAQH